MNRIRLVIAALILAAATEGAFAAGVAEDDGTRATLLTDPFLQAPTSDSVSVVWFTDFEGRSHTLVYGERYAQSSPAITTRMTRLTEAVEGRRRIRSVWRHEAVAEGLRRGVRVPYYVASTREDGRTARSGAFTLHPLPAPGQDVRILITSDHQLMPNTHINLELVEKTIGRVDAVFLAGDLVNIPDNSEEWFERTERGIGFFPALQGRAREIDPAETFAGGEIVQHAHLFPVIGNHEVMGSVDPESGLARWGGDRPLWYARAAEPGATGTDVTAGSWNVETYREIFSLPDDAPDGEEYYAIAYGDIFLVGLFTTRPWRARKFSEEFPNDPSRWTFGDFLYREYGRGSRQFAWLQRALTSEAALDARFRYVMTHQTSRGFGDNSVPLLVQPRATYEARDGRVITLEFPLSPDQWDLEVSPLVAALAAVRYDYPRERDAWAREVEPLLIRTGVDIVHHGHSHIWYRGRIPDGPHIIETSNVGNSYGAYIAGYKERGRFSWPQTEPREWYDLDNYATTGDPYRLAPASPSEFSPMEHEGAPLPTVDSSDLTVFTILESPSGVVTSYVYDTRRPDDGVRVFDRFTLSSR